MATWSSCRRPAPAARIASCRALKDTASRKESIASHPDVQTSQVSAIAAPEQQPAATSAQPVWVKGLAIIPAAYVALIVVVKSFRAIQNRARGSLAGLEDRGHLSHDRHSQQDVKWDAARVGRELSAVNYTEWEDPSQDLIAKHRKRRVADFDDGPIDPGKNVNMQGLEIPENHPFLDTDPALELTDDVVAQRLNAQPQQRRRRGPGKPALTKTDAHVDLVLSEQERQQAALEAEAAEVALYSEQGQIVRGIDTAPGDHLGLDGLADGRELSRDEVEAIKRRSALRARRHMTGSRQ